MSEAVKKLWDEKKQFSPAPGVTVTLRHVGTSEDRFRFKRLNAEWNRAREELRLASRKKLIELYGSAEAAADGIMEGREGASFSAAVTWWMEQQEPFIDAISLRAKALITEGTEDGVKTYDKVGAAGEQAIRKTMDAVFIFNSLDPALGEG